MLSQRVGQLLTPYDFRSRLVGACGVGLLLGVAALWLSPLWVLAGMLGTLVLAAIAYRPELGLLAILVVTSGLVNAARLPALKLGAISLHIPDLILLYLLALVLMKALVVPSFKVVRTPLDVPLIWFYFAILLSVAIALTRSSLDMNFVLRRLRPLTYWLVFFAVTNLITTRSQLVQLVRGMFCVGLLIAGTMVIQAGLGQSVLIMGGWILQDEAGLIRFFHPGALIVYIVLITLICDMALHRREKYRLLRPLQAILLGAGLVATLTRHPLVAAVMSLAMLVFILRRSELSALARNVLLTAVIALLIIGALAIGARESLVLEYLTVYADRLQSMFSARILTPDENLAPRWTEIRYAWSHIVENPVFGIGLGSPYRPRLYEGEVIAYYLHNAYLWIWLAAGLFGLIPFLWLSVLFLRRGLRYWRGTKSRFLRSVTLGFTLAYLGMMISNLVAPSFLQDWGLAVFGVILGVNEAIRRHDETRDERYEEGGFT